MSGRRTWGSILQAGGPSTSERTLGHAGAGPRPAASFGLETDTGYAGDALYFWARPERFGDGIAWLFPTGRGSRVGLGSYQGATKLNDL